MAIAGRPNKPTAIKLLEGRRVDFAQTEPMFAAASIEPPEVLSPVAAAEWRRLAPLLSARGLLTDGDVSALVAYCTTYELMITAAEDVRREGATYENKRGERATNPSANTLLKAASLLRSYCTEFGFTPASRAKIAAAVVEDSGEMDPMEQLLNYRN